MGQRIAYGKIGRSMPLSLQRCGSLGGDVECAAVVGQLARRHPDDTFILFGRNDGSDPATVGLPHNVVNPWREWAPELRRQINTAGLNHASLTVDEQLRLRRIFADLTDDTARRVDQFVMWVGQHGTTNTPVPSIQRPGELTKPHDWSALYCSFILQAINYWRDEYPRDREEVYLNADPRNRHKMRDLKWPLAHPVLTQYTYLNNLKHERYGESTRPSDLPWANAHWTQGVGDTHGQSGPYVWTSRVSNVYSRLEVNGLAPGTPFGDLISYDDDWDRPGDFGLFINEARVVGIRPELSRLHVFRDWVAPLDPYFVCGTWSKGSQEQLGRWIGPAPWDEYYPRLHSIRCTLTTPSSGSGWATAKPWEAFAAGTVCFFHPAYDVQNNILGDASESLRDWLRVSTPGELRTRIEHLSTTAGRDDWEWLVRTQRAHFDAALEARDYLAAIERRLYGHTNLPSSQGSVTP